MYELTYILTPLLTENNLNPTVDKIRGFLNSLGSEIKQEKITEKKKLSYPIKKQNFGYYVNCEFKVEGEKLADLQSELKATPEILRFLIITKDEVAAVQRAPRPTRASEPTKLTKSRVLTEKPEAPEKPKKEEKVKIEELDKKLEEILEG